jgi:hypothetical protein
MVVFYNFLFRPFRRGVININPHQNPLGGYLSDDINDGYLLFTMGLASFVFSVGKWSCG